MQYHLETFLDEVQEADPMGWGVPTWVERGFRGYLRCGILAPQAYKQLDEVLEFQGPTVEVIERLHPLIVCMAPDRSLRQG